MGGEHVSQVQVPAFHGFSGGCSLWLDCTHKTSRGLFHWIRQFRRSSDFSQSIRRVQWAATPIWPKQTRHEERLCRWISCIYSALHVSAKFERFCGKSNSCCGAELRQPMPPCAVIARRVAPVVLICPFVIPLSALVPYLYLSTIDTAIAAIGHIIFRVLICLHLSWSHTRLRFSLILSLMEITRSWLQKMSTR